MSPAQTTPTPTPTFPSAAGSTFCDRVPSLPTVRSITGFSGLRVVNDVANATQAQCLFQDSSGNSVAFFGEWDVGIDPLVKATRSDNITVTPSTRIPGGYESAPQLLIGTATSYFYVKTVSLISPITPDQELDLDAKLIKLWGLG